MKIKSRPLINPSPDDFLEDENNKDFEPAYSVSKDQLKLQIDSAPKRFTQFVNGLKYRLSQRNDFLEASQMWKGPAIPFAIMSSIFSILMLTIAPIFSFGSISPKVPLFYDTVGETWYLSDKSMLFVVPVFLIFSEILILNFIVDTFRFNRRLSLTMAWVLSLINVLIQIAAVEIFVLIK